MIAGKPFHDKYGNFCDLVVKEIRFAARDALTIELPRLRWGAQRLERLTDYQTLVAHRSSMGCGFDPRLGLRNRFSENRV